MKAQIPRLPMVVIMATGFALAVSTSIRAEYYRYVDQSGTVRYTDNIFDVPYHQRAGAKKIISGESPAEDGASAPAPSGKEDFVKSEQTDAEDPEKLEYESLTEQKAALDKEYEALIEEKEMLTRNKDKMDIETYNQRVRQFNEKTKAYEARRQAFEKAADAFNARLSQ